MKVIIAGGRDFEDYDYLCVSLHHAGIRQRVSEVVCGMARGADALGAEWAHERAIPVKYFPADWKQHGRGAGAIRNLAMAKYADALVAFWDGQSPGTKDMIKDMLAFGKELHVFPYLNLPPDAESQA